MRNLSEFMKPNKIEKENIFYPASESFLDSKGSVLLWEMKAISSDEDAKLRAGSYKTVPVLSKNGKPLKNQTTKEFQAELYTAKLTAATIVYPDLLNAELQDSYQVKDPIALLRTMLNPGELSDLMVKAQELCGFDNEIKDELVEEAKN